MALRSAAKVPPMPPAAPLPGSWLMSLFVFFRIISAKSKPDSWWYRKQGKPGIDIMGALERTAKPQIDEVVKEIFTN